MKALIVEPSTSSRLFVSMALKSKGVLTDDVSNEEEAEDLLRENEYQFICVARILKSGDCRDFCCRLRSQAATKNIPILVLTASETADTESYLALGVTEVISRQDIASLIAYVDALKKDANDDIRSGGKILYIEDSLSIAALVTRLLEKRGYQVTHFTTGEEALKHYKDGSYHLVLTDVVLAGHINGPALVRHIRKQEKTMQFPVSILAISGYEDASRTLSLFQAGVNDYVRKPILDEELLARVDNLILNQRLFSKLEDQQRHLEQVAMVDQLTQLYNQHYLMDVAQKKLVSAQRNSTCICLINIEIDAFRSTSLFLGPQTTDHALCEISKLFLEHTREDDIVARIDESKFAIVIEYSAAEISAQTPLENATARAETLRAIIEKSRYQEADFTASFGVVQNNTETDFKRLFERSQTAIDQAKEQGRNCVVA